MRKEKEKLQIGVKSSQKTLESLQRRRETLDCDSTKLYEDFKEAIQFDKSAM